MNKEDFTFLSIDEYNPHTKLILTTHIHSIMNTMKDWCSKNQRDGNLRGFAIYAYSKILKLSGNVLQHHLYKVTCEDSHETVIVYNPAKQVILLIRIAVDKNLEDEIKLSTNDIMTFVLTFFDVLSRSGVKLINLLVTGEELVNYQPRCDSCKHQIISAKFFSSSKSFDGWWEKKENKFSISVIHGDINKNFHSRFLARIVYLVDSFQLNYSIEQVTEATVMTFEQTRTRKKGSMSEMLETMNPSNELNYSVKNTMEINRLVTDDAIVLQPFDPDSDAENPKFLQDITSEIPNLYEIHYPEESVKFKMFLLFILRKVMNPGQMESEIDASNNNDLADTQHLEKQVIIHFDAQNDIPKSVHIVFKLMGITDSVTSNYGEFERDHKKKIFVCNYHDFRGLKFPRVIVFLDPSLYSWKHYFVKSFSRCTRSFHIIAPKVLNIPNWKQELTLQRIVETWKKSFDEKQLLFKQWNVKIINVDEDSNQISQPADSVLSQQIRIRITDKQYSEVEKKIENILTTTAEDPEETASNSKETKSG